MAGIQTFQDLFVWQKAHALTLAVYNVTKQWPTDEKFGLISQARRASVSISANIVEGYRRKSTKDSMHFYNMADASLEETKYHLLLAKDLSYMTNQDYKTILDIAEETGKMLCGWIKSQKNYQDNM